MAVRPTVANAIPVHPCYHQPNVLLCKFLGLDVLAGAYPEVQQTNPTT